MNRQSAPLMRPATILKTLLISTVLLSFGQLGRATAQEQNPVDVSSGNQTVSNNLLSHRQVFWSLAKSGMFGGKASMASEKSYSSQASISRPEDWVDKAMAKHSFVWSSADGIDTGSAFIFPGADPKTGAQYVFAALPDHSILGVVPVPERSAVRLLDLSTGSAVELASGGLSTPLVRQGGMEKEGKAGQSKPQIDLPGIASNIATVASCLWDQVTSTLSVQSWQDFANLACQIASRGSEIEQMYDFGKEVTGCASLGIADCFFTASDVGLFISNASCRPDWVNTCVVKPSPGGDGGGAATPAMILGVTPLSTPVPGQQFSVQIQVMNLAPSNFSVVLVGPGCPTTSSCDVSSGVTTPISSTLLNVPLKLAQGTFTLYILQLGQLSNGWPLSVGASSGGGGGNNTPNLGINFSPNPVPNGGGGTWDYSVTIAETGGAPVTIASLNVGGKDCSAQIQQWFGSNQLPANGRLSGSFTSSGGSGGNLTWTFAGGGRSWSATVSLLQ